MKEITMIQKGGITKIPADGSKFGLYSEREEGRLR